MRSAFVVMLGTLLCLSTTGNASATVCVPVSLGQVLDESGANVESSIVFIGRVTSTAAGIAPRTGEPMVNVVATVDATLTADALPAVVTVVFEPGFRTDAGVAANRSYLFVVSRASDALLHAGPCIVPREVLSREEAQKLSALGPDANVRTDFAHLPSVVLPTRPVAAPSPSAGGGSIEPASPPPHWPLAARALAVALGLALAGLGVRRLVADKRGAPR